MVGGKIIVIESAPIVAKGRYAEVGKLFVAVNRCEDKGLFPTVPQAPSVRHSRIVLRISSVYYRVTVPNIDRFGSCKRNNDYREPWTKSVSK
jgi:hypothetical protein